jgi:hypothetical protein
MPSRCPTLPTPWVPAEALVRVGDVRVQHEICDRTTEPNQRTVRLNERENTHLGREWGARWSKRKYRQDFVHVAGG